MVDRIQKANVRDPVIDEKSDIKMFEKYAQHCKLNNTLAIVQINHPGRQTPNAVSRTPLAPSAIQVKGGSSFKFLSGRIYSQPTAMTE